MTVYRCAASSSPTRPSCDLASRKPTSPAAKATLARVASLTGSHTAAAGATLPHSATPAPPRARTPQPPRPRSQSVAPRPPRCDQLLPLLADVALQFIDRVGAAARLLCQAPPPLPDPTFEIRHGHTPQSLARVACTSS